jgi:hypothetical protein
MPASRMYRLFIGFKEHDEKINPRELFIENLWKGLF